jgi:hypothetical protein
MILLLGLALMAGGRTLARLGRGLSSNLLAYAWILTSTNSCGTTRRRTGTLHGGIGEVGLARWLLAAGR